MANINRLSKYEIKEALSDSDNVVILCSGDLDYYKILKSAFKHIKFSKEFKDKTRRYDWGAYLYSPSIADLSKLEILLELMKSAIYVKDNMSQTFALDSQMRPSYEGDGRTEVGELVYQSKPYKNRFTENHKNHAIQLSEHFIDFIRKHPCYMRSQAVVAVPYTDPKDFDLPSFIASYISEKLNIPNAEDYVLKHPTERSMKDCRTLEEKRHNIFGKFEISNVEFFKDKEIIIIDDIYQSGLTMYEFGTTLQGAEAIVRSLVATKTFSAVNNR